MVKMENDQETILDALNEFGRKPVDRVPPVLDQYLLQIAKTGETWFPWPKLKPLFIHKLKQVMQEFHQQVPTDGLPKLPNVENVSFEDMKERLLDTVNTFTGAPFTIQRLCELVTNPSKHYKRTDKFLRGIEKNVLVVSTVDPFGNKIVQESKMMLNGNDADSYLSDKQSPDTTQLSPNAFSPSAPNTSPSAGPVPWLNQVAVSWPQSTTSSSDTVHSSAADNPTSASESSGDSHVSESGQLMDQSQGDSNPADSNEETKAAVSEEEPHQNGHAESDRSTANPESDQSTLNPEADCGSAMERTERQGSGDSQGFETSAIEKEQDQSTNSQIKEADSADNVATETTPQSTAEPEASHDQHQGEGDVIKTEQVSSDSVSAVETEPKHDNLQTDEPSECSEAAAEPVSAGECVETKQEQEKPDASESVVSESTSEKVDSPSEGVPCDSPSGEEGKDGTSGNTEDVPTTDPSQTEEAMDTAESSE